MVGCWCFGGFPLKVSCKRNPVGNGCEGVFSVVEYDEGRSGIKYDFWGKRQMKK